MTKQLYLGLWASNPKNKNTLFPVTFKVSGNKVVLFFYWRPTDQDITDLSFHDILSQNNPISIPYQWLHTHSTNIHRYFEITLIIIFIDWYKYMLYVYITTDRVLKFGYFETKYHEMTNQLYLSLWASNKKIRSLYFLKL